MESVRILVVEDQMITATVLEESLSKAGYAVCGIARSFDEAIAISRTENPDIALIDIDLGKNVPDGIATALALLRYKEMPIIYLTANTDQLNRAKITNPAAFLGKPFRPEDVLNQIELAIHNFYSEDLPRTIRPSDPLFLPFEKAHIRVAKDDIRYIKAQRNYSEIFLTPSSYQKIVSRKTGYSPILLTLNAGYLFKHLSTNFFRLSKSIIVNLNHIDRIEADTVYMAEDQIAIPEGKHKPLLERLNTVKGRSGNS